MMHRTKSKCGLYGQLSVDESHVDVYVLGSGGVLADQFYLIAHEDRTGRSRLHPRATGIGLAASLLG
jgi:hypothetical protein